MGEIKIIAGKFKGRNVQTPLDIRPTQSLIRKAIFDTLGDISGLRFLELFAGSGSIGFEAFSRGVGEVVWVESNLTCSRIIEKNLRSLDPHEELKAQIITSDSVQFLEGFYPEDEKFDIIFLDPPYREELARKTLNLLSHHDIVQPNSVVIVEHSRESLPENEGRLLRVREKKYGKSTVSVYQVQ